MSKFRLSFFLSAAVVSTACATSTPVTESPLPLEQQERLRCTLLGTWKLEAIDQEPVEVVDQYWVFGVDGSGVYQQRPGEGPGAATVTGGDNPFQWRLEGRNIFLEGTKGSRTTVFRADDFGTQKMSWFNYRLSDRYSVVRTAAAETGCTP